MNKEILNTRGGQAFYMGAENVKSKVPKKVPKRVDTYLTLLEFSHTPTEFPVTYYHNMLRHEWKIRK
jgi:hypothetical protein